MAALLLEELPAGAPDAEVHDELVVRTRYETLHVPLAAVRDAKSPAGGEPAARHAPAGLDEHWDGDGMPMGLDALAGGRPSPLQVAAWNEEVSLIDDITSQPRRSPQKRLEQMIEFDEQQAAAVLKQWIHKKEAA